MSSLRISDIINVIKQSTAERNTRTIWREIRLQKGRLSAASRSIFLEIRNTIVCWKGARPHPPGDHGAKRSKETEYGNHLREKQQLSFAYGMSETQFKHTFMKAKKMKGAAGENLLVLLERRLDNVVYRLGMASSRSQARQIVIHGHITVNGRNVTSPSYRVRPSAVISPQTSSKSQNLLKTFLAENKHRTVPEWLSFSQEKTLM
ncbi:MAG: 30S ribosomal protein S4 [Spirochaetales bacterium]|nr:MAG: 30S ribosomal protein S4 [Spirochaetales bacterium]